MGNLSSHDQAYLSPEQQAQIQALKDQYAAAQTDAERQSIHQQAEAIRNAAGYSGGADGSGYTSLSANNGSQSASPSQTLSSHDQAYLSAQQQAQIQALKDQYAAAQTDAERQSIHQQAEAIRNAAGYSGGADGSGHITLSANNGGQDASAVQAWIDDYMRQNYNPVKGYTNGYSTAMNSRAKANYIRQQMEANSRAWHTADAATREYLHQQNVLLAQMLADNGGATSYYDSSTGRWSTWNPNYGYGDDLAWTQPNVVNSWREYYGYTDADRARWDADTSRYHNFVDVRVPGRNSVDESSGFTGMYAQFVNGPHNYLLGGAPGGALDSNYHMYTDVHGDGFHDEKDGAAYRLPVYDENGNIVKTAPYLKDNNGITDYTKSMVDYTHNGIIMPGMTSGGSGRSNSNMARSTASHPEEEQEAVDRQVAYAQAYRNATGGMAGSAAMNQVMNAAAGAGGAGSYEDYLTQMYDAALQAQLSQLETSHNQNVSNLDTAVQQTADQYAESRRQASGQAAQDAASWRELANAYGLNSGAIGQAALAQNNQLQSNLNALQAAESAAQDELARNRLLLGQQYQAAINEAIANNDMQRAQALYQEAVRAEEQLLAQQQFNAQLALQYAQMAMQQSQWQQEFDYQQQMDAMQMAAAAMESGSAQVVMADPNMVYQLYRDAYASPNPENYIATYYKNYGLTKTTGLWDGFQNWVSQYNIQNNSPSDVFNNLVDRLSNTLVFQGRTDRLDLVDEYVSKGLITPDQGAQLISMFGLGG